MKASTISKLDTDALKEGDIVYQAEYFSNGYGKDAEIKIHKVKVLGPVPGRKGWFKVKVDENPEKNSNLAYGNYATEKEAVMALKALFTEMLDTANKKLKEYK